MAPLPSAAPAAPAPAATAPAAGPSPATAAPAATAGATDAELTVGDQDLLALAAADLTANADQAVTGTATVESVVADEGFWVGRDTTNRVFVYLTPEARKANGESGFQVTQGQTIKLTGTLLSAAGSPASLTGVTDSEGLAQLTTQGAFVNADTVALSS